jgi:hypothetical protein
MLPGFRFLSVAVVLAVSMLIFGLGAAALLRATHEEFASVPLKQMPEVTFGPREGTEQPTLAVLQVDTPAAHPTEPAPDQAEHPATTAPGAQPESTAAAPPATDAPSVATDSATPAASAAPSAPVSPAADTAPSADSVAAEPSEPPPRVEPSLKADDAAKPDIAKTDVTKSDAAKSDVGASDVAATMTSPFGKHFKAPLPVNRPAQAAQVADPTPPAAERSAAKPPRAAKRHRHRHRRVIRQSRRSSQPAVSRSQFDSD